MAPTYPFECGKCETEIDVIKPMSKSGDPEFCPKCDFKMERIYTVPELNTSTCRFEAHYNYGLGKTLTKKSDVKEQLRRIKDETGKEIVEIGNDKQESVKIQKKKYTLDKEDYQKAIATIDQGSKAKKHEGENS